MEKQNPQLVPGQCFDHAAYDDERQPPVIPTGQAAPAQPAPKPRSQAAAFPSALARETQGFQASSNILNRCCF